MGRKTVTAAAVLLLACAASLAQAPDVVTLRVGTKESPPFSMRDGENWRGVSIELFRELATELGRELVPPARVEIAFEERELADLFGGLEDGSLDAAVAALTVTAERERSVDFTHPFYETGLGIAVAPERGSDWAALLAALPSGAFLEVAGVLLLLLLAVGTVVWIFERKKNREQFGGRVARGLGSGLWWSAVTMTTVGYGDKAPATLGGRTVGLVWMFASVILISGFTAAIASSLTVSSLDSFVNGPDDLPHVTVGTVPRSTSAAWLRAEGITSREYATTRAALEALAAGRVDAVVYDMPLLRYIVKNEFSETLAVLPEHFERQDYAIALPQGSDIREPMNRVLLEKLEGDWWDELLHEYLGR